MEKPYECQQQQRITSELFDTSRIEISCHKILQRDILVRTQNTEVPYRIGLPNEKAFQVCTWMQTDGGLNSALFLLQLYS